MKIAIVANGPSAGGCGQEIDACDFVVRMKRWLTRGPLDAGNKVNAIAGFDNQVEITPELRIDFSWELWFSIPPAAIKPNPTLQDPADLSWAFQFAGPRPIRFFRNEAYFSLIKYLIGQKSAQRDPHISLGMVCIAMALELNPEEIHIWGYDRVIHGTQEANWAQEACADTPETDAHDWIAQKRILLEFADEGKWLGQPCKTKLIWHDRPPMDEATMNSKDFLIVLPARMGSTRLPGKMLLDIHGQPMIIRSWENAVRQAQGSRVIIATDNKEIYDICRARGAEAEMTSSTHKTGTDRVAEICLRYPQYKYIINMQPDEPLMEDGAILAIKRALITQKVSCCGLTALGDDHVYKENIGKVVTDSEGFVLYISRAPIPFNSPVHYTQICIYGFPREALIRFASLPQGTWEQYEKIELLRWIEAGYAIKAVAIPGQRLAVDVPEDIDIIRSEYAQKHGGKEQ